MIFKLVFLVAIAAIAQATSTLSHYKYSPNKEKQLLGVLFLREFEVFLTINFNETRECYKVIQQAYREELKIFKKGVSVEIPLRDQFVLRSAISFSEGDSYETIAQKALLKLRGIAYLVVEYENRMREFLENYEIDASFAQSIAIKEIKTTKKDAQELFIDYEFFRRMFSHRPKWQNSYYLPYYVAFNYVNKVFAIDRLFMKLKKCIQEKENNF